MILFRKTTEYGRVVITLTKRANNVNDRTRGSRAMVLSHSPYARIDRNYLPGATDFLSAGGPHVVSGGSEQSNTEYFA